MKKILLFLFFMAGARTIAFAGEETKKTTVQASKITAQTKIYKKDCQTIQIPNTTECSNGETRTNTLVYNTCDPVGTSTIVYDPRGDCPMIPPTPPNEP